MAGGPSPISYSSSYSNSYRIYLSITSTQHASGNYTSVTVKLVADATSGMWFDGLRCTGYLNITYVNSAGSTVTANWSENTSTMRSLSGAGGYYVAKTTSFDTYHQSDGTGAFSGNGLFAVAASYGNVDQSFSYSMPARSISTVYPLSTIDYDRSANTPYYTNITRNSDPASFTLAYASTGSVNGPTTYVMERATDSAMSANYTTSNVGSVNANTSYYYRMYAYGDEGGNKYSGVYGPYHGQPTATQNTSASTSSNTINAISLSWASPSYTGAGIGSYEVWEGGTRLYSGTSTSYTVPNLTRGSSHTYDIRAVSNSGGGTPVYNGIATSVTATASGVPSAPGIPTISSKVGRNIIINSSRGSSGFNNSISEYRIQLSTDNGSTWKGWDNTTKSFTSNGSSNILDSSGNFSYQLLTPALTYLWRVYAVNTFGAGDTSVTTLGTFVSAGGRRRRGSGEVNADTFQPTEIARRHDGTTWIDLTVAKRHDGTSWVDLT